MASFAPKNMSFHVLISKSILPRLYYAVIVIQKVLIPQKVPATRVLSSPSGVAEEDNIEVWLWRYVTWRYVTLRDVTDIRKSGQRDMSVEILF